MLEVPDVSLDDILESIEEEPQSREVKEIRRIVKELTEKFVNEEMET